MEQSSGQQRLSLIAIFTVGLFVGWVIIGSWLAPGRSDSNPWESHLEQQMSLVSLLAEDLWRTGDIARIQKVVAGWDEQALAKLLTATDLQLSDPEARQHLSALRQALALPESGITLGMILSQKPIILSSSFGLLLLVAAALVAFVPLEWSAARQVDRGVDAQQAGGDQQPGQQEGQTPRQGGGESDPERSQGQQEGQTSGQPAQNGAAPAQAGEGRPGQDQQGQQQGGGQQQPQGQQVQAGGQQQPQGQQRQNQANQEAEGLLNLGESEEEKKEEEGIQGLLSEIFLAGEEELLDLQVLTKDLEDVDISELLWKSREVADQLEKLQPQPVEA